jgi:multiple sugar transport system substrate-binding protein
MSRKLRNMLALTLVVVMLMAIVPMSSAQERVTVTWFVGLGTGTNEQQIDVQNRIVDEFNASQDAIELVINIAGSNQTAPDVLSTLIASGEAPDIVGPVGFAGSNQYAGQWLDLAPLVESTGYDLAQFPENLVDAYRSLDGEQLLGLPFAVFPGVLYYNADLFDEAGLNYPPTEPGVPYVMPDGTEVPWDYDTVVEIGKILTVDANGYDATMEEFDPNSIIQFGFIHQWDTMRSDFHTFGANYVVDDMGTVHIWDNWRAEAQWLWDAVWTSHIAPTSSYEQSEILGPGNAFESGNMAMARSMLWYTCCLGNLSANWDLAVQPAYDGTIYAPIDMDTFRIHNSTQHPEEAFTVLSYLLDEAALDLLTTYGGYPARPEIQDAAIQAKAEQYPSVQNWDVVTTSIPLAPNPHHEEWYPNFQKGQIRFEDFRVLIYSEGGADMDVDAELDRLQSDLQAIVDEVQ